MFSNFEGLYWHPFSGGVTTQNPIIVNNDAFWEAINVYCTPFMDSYSRQMMKRQR